MKSKKNGAPPSPNPLLTLNLIPWKTRCKSSRFSQFCQIFFANFSYKISLYWLMSTKHFLSLRKTITIWFSKR